MDRKQKYKTLTFLVISIFLAVILAAGLSRLTLEPGLPLPEIKSGQGKIVIESRNINRIVFSINKVVLIFIIVLAAVVICIGLFKIIKRVEWKFVLTVLLSILLACIAVAGFLIVVLYLLPHSKENIVNETYIPIIKEPLKSPLGDPPVILLWIAGIIPAGLFIFLIIRFFRSNSNKEDALFHIKLEAEKAMKELLRGYDLKGVITRCYKEMCNALEKEKNILREESMTVEEFRVRLEEAGAPEESIRELTVLFETARYGNTEPLPVDEQKAVRCFEAIIAGIREDKQ
jgi:hypothetical protein